MMHCGTVVDAVEVLEVVIEVDDVVVEDEVVVVVFRTTLNVRSSL